MRERNPRRLSRRAAVEPQRSRLPARTASDGRRIARECDDTRVRSVPPSTRPTPSRPRTPTSPRGPNFPGAPPAIASQKSDMTMWLNTDCRVAGPTSRSGAQVGPPPGIHLETRCLLLPERGDGPSPLGDGSGRHSGSPLERSVVIQAHRVGAGHLPLLGGDRNRSRPRPSATSEARRR